MTTKNYTLDTDAAARFLRKKLNEADAALRMVEKIALDAGEDGLAEKVGYAITAVSDAESYL